MKKVLFMVMLLLGICGTCFGAFSPDVKQVSVIVDSPQLMHSDTEFYKAIDKKVRIIFASNRFVISPSIADALLQVHQYRQDHNMIMENGSGKFLSTSDVQSIGKQFGSNYVLHVETYAEGLNTKIGFFSAKIRYTTIVNLKLMDVTTGKFIQVKQFTQKGETGTSGDALKTQFEVFVPECLSKNPIDTAQL